MFRAVANSFVVPAFVSQYSVVFDPADESVLDVEIPNTLRAAMPKRRIEFAAGRHCAREALRLLAPSVVDTPITVASDGSPAWPAGFSGSITHTHAFASAIVARAAEAIGLGLDSERLIEPATAAKIAYCVATTDEISRLSGATNASLPLLVTAVFSAKESIFKCLHRFVGRYFDFLDAEITTINLTAGTFSGRLVRSLSDTLVGGTVVCGRVNVDAEMVHTGLVLVTLGQAPRWG